MRKEAYERIFACIQKTRYGVKIINGISTAITYVTAVLEFLAFYFGWCGRKAIVTLVLR